MLSSGKVIKEDYLSVVFTLKYLARATVTGSLHLRVDIDNLSVSFVSEEKALVGTSVNSKVRRISHTANLRLPMVETQISLSWQELLFVFENTSEVLCFHSVSQIDVSTDFFAWLLNSQE